MKNIRITIISLLVFLIIPLVNNAQENKTVMDLLTQNSWRNVFYTNKTDSIISIVTYTKTLHTELCIFWYAKDATAEAQHNFYLSDEPDAVFDENKVGKALNGKYIIIKRNSSSEVLRYKILKLSKTELQILIVRLSKDKVRIGGEPTPKPATYYAIPKRL